MSQIRVESIEAIKAMKVALIKFIETANAALGDADSDASRTLTWLEHDQASHWTNQLRKRHDMVEKCKEALRMKQLYKDASGGRQSAVEEEKALRKAVASYEEAQQKQLNVKRSIPKLQREIQMYHGSVQRFATTVQVQLREAGHKLEDLLRTLDAYVGYSPSEVGSVSSIEPTSAGASLDASVGSIARPQPATPDDPSKQHNTEKDNTKEQPHGTA